MIYKQLALMLTETCTAACRFCGVRCNPQKKGVMSVELLHKAIDEAKALGTFDRVGLSGGEVFLYPELVKEALDYAKEAGFSRRTVATNGFWGAWSDEKQDEVLESMKDSLTEVAFSHDAFHAEYVKTEYIWRAVKALERHGIYYTIHVADTRGEMGAAEFLASCDKKVFYRHYKLYPLAAMGNAEDLPPEIFVREQNWDETWCYPDGIITIDCHGDVYPCCCPGVFSTGFKLGNINDTPLSQIVTGSAGMKYINVMTEPARFVKMLRYAKEELGVELPEKTVNGCELCYMVFSQPDIFKKLAPFFDKEYNELVMSRLFKAEEKQ